MRSLFLRIFLWFWVAMAAVVAVLVVTSPLLTRSRPGLDRWREDAEAWAVRRAEGAAAQITERGVDGLRMGRGPGPGRRGAPDGPARLFVIDESGVEVYGADPPPEVAELAARTLAESREQTERVGALHLVSRLVTDPDGRRVAVVAAHHSPPRLVHLLEPKALGWRLGVLLLVVGGLSFLLARYLSSPVAPLRRATRRLSAGDLTARVGSTVGRRHDEIGELARDFDAMAERIETLVGAHQRLLRDVSHELRSPLARLGVALELLRRESGPGEAGHLDRMEREIDRLDGLIGQLLLLERIQGGVDEGDDERFDIAELLAEVVADAGYEAASEHREFRFNPGDGGEARGRPELLRSAFDNLLRNGMQHTPAGTAVEVAVHTTDQAFEIEIRDHGPGVADDELERIFEPFYRVHEARERATGGSGLGLAIADRAIRAHGGAIRASNHPDGGLVVTVRLPRA